MITSSATRPACGSVSRWLERFCRIRHSSCSTSPRSDSTPRRHAICAIASASSKHRAAPCFSPRITWRRPTSSAIASRSSTTAGSSRLTHRPRAAGMSLLAADLRAFFAAGLKEVRQQRRYPTLFLGQLFWPMLLPAFWVLMGRAYSGNDPQALAAFAERAGSSNVAIFVFVGYAMYNWLSALLWGAGTALRQEQLRGTLEAVFVTPASRLVPLFGPGVGTLLPMALTFASNFVALRFFFGIFPPIGAVIQAAVIVVLGVAALYAIGAPFAARVLRFGEGAPVVHLIGGMFVLAGGSTIPRAILPLWAQVWTKILPPTYIVDDIRRILLRGDTVADVAGDVAIVLSLAAVTGILAVAVFRYLETSARRTGMLGQF